MSDAAGQSVQDILAPHRNTRIRLFFSDKALLAQMENILSALKFTNVEPLPSSRNFLENSRQLAQALIREEALFLVGPPLAVANAKGGAAMHKDIGDYFSNVKLLLSRARKDDMLYLSRCVPVFADIRYTQKRENTILSLTRFGIGGAFILKQQESLLGLSAKARQERLKEQLMERFAEVREYLEEFLPYRENALEAALEKKEELELSQRKAEADEWIKKAEQCKRAKDFDQAVACYTKAIDIYPTDPGTYIESGRVYVRLKKYPQAFQRFRQAEEVGETIPKPNKEIGNTRAEQIKELVERGTPPNDEKLTAMLEEAVVHFETALKKASKMQPLLQDEGRARDVEAVSDVAGDIFKLELESVFGKRHPLLARLRGAARDALEEVSSGEPSDLAAPQLICMGLAAIDEGNYKEAQEYLFQAAGDKECFSQACTEINYLGTVVRKELGPDKALPIYERLIRNRAPNRPAVYFNLAVAQVSLGRELEAIGSIAHAVYMDPFLPESNQFYGQPQLHAVLLRLVEYFETVSRASGRVSTPKGLAKLLKLKERIEAHVREGNQDTAMGLLKMTAAKVPAFFERREILGSPLLMEFLRDLQSAPNTDSGQAEFFLQVLDRSEALNTPEPIQRHLELMGQSLHELEATADQAEAADILARAVAAWPGALKTSAFYSNTTLVNLALELDHKLSEVDTQRIKRLLDKAARQKPAQKAETTADADGAAAPQ